MDCIHFRRKLDSIQTIELQPALILLLPERPAFPLRLLNKISTMNKSLCVFYISKAFLSSSLHSKTGMG